MQKPFKEIIDFYMERFEEDAIKDSQEYYLKDPI